MATISHEDRIAARRDIREARRLLEGARDRLGGRLVTRQNPKARQAPDRRVRATITDGIDACDHAVAQLRKLIGDADAPDAADPAPTDAAA